MMAFTFLLVVQMGADGMGNAEVLQCPEGMVSYWSFDDENDPGKDDYGVNHGTSIVNVDWDPDGKVGGAMRFYEMSYNYGSGEDSYLDIGTGAISLQTLSIAAWVKSAVSNQYWGCFISNCQPGYSDQWAVWWGCCAEPERQNNILFAVQGRGEGILPGNTELEKEKWYFVVAINDKAFAITWRSSDTMIFFLSIQRQATSSIPYSKSWIIAPLSLMGLMPKPISARLSAKPMPWTIRRMLYWLTTKIIHPLMRPQPVLSHRLFLMEMKKWESRCFKCLLTV
jgi:hypothetical protein